MKTFLKMNLPNKLTTLRMVMVLVVIFIALFPWNGINFKMNFFEALKVSFLSNQNIVWLRITMCVLFVVASFTDFLDGNIARKRGLVTTYGKFMDPIADKLLVNSTFIILACWGNLPVGILLVMICRDTIVDAIRLIMCQKNIVVPANIFGKIKTTMQMVAIPMLLIFPLIKGLNGLHIDLVFAYLAAVSSLVSGIIYFIQAKDYVLEGATTN